MIQQIAFSMSFFFSFFFIPQSKSWMESSGSSHFSVTATLAANWSRQHAKRPSTSFTLHLKTLENWCNASGLACSSSFLLSPSFTELLFLLSSILSSDDIHRVTMCTHSCLLSAICNLLRTWTVITETGYLWSKERVLIIARTKWKQCKYSRNLVDFANKDTASLCMTVISPTWYTVKLM